MINQQLLAYIRQQMQQGVSREQIKSSLMANDWEASDVEEGFKAITPGSVPTPPPTLITPTMQSIQPSASFMNPAVSPESQSVLKINNTSSSNMNENNKVSSNLLVVKGGKQLFRIIIATAIVFILVIFLTYLARQQQGWDGIGFLALLLPLLYLGVAFALIGFFRSIYLYFKTSDKKFAIFLAIFATTLTILFEVYIRL